MGLSTSTSRFTGLKVVTAPDAVSGSSAVPKRQPSGRVTLGWTVMFRDQRPAG